MTHRRSKARVLGGTLGAVIALLTLIAASCSNEPEEIVGLSAIAQEGQLLAKESACQACHTTDGESATGPTWKGLYGETITLQDGGEVTVDDEYIIRAVREPNAERREGTSGQMGSYDDKRLSDEDLDKIIAFIKELK